LPQCNFRPRQTGVFPPCIQVVVSPWNPLVDSRHIKNNDWPIAMTQRLLMPGIFVLSLLLPACSVFVPVQSAQPIDRLALVSHHQPQLDQVDPRTPCSLGTCRFAFTADVLGLQSLPVRCFADGIPLETKARWAWLSRANPAGCSLGDDMESYPA